MDELLGQKGFFQKLFDAIPALTLVVDAKGNVRAINEATANLLGSPEEVVQMGKGGNILSCVNAMGNECGLTPVCDFCVIRKTSMEAIQGHTVRRAKGDLEIISQGKSQLIRVLVSSAPFNYKGQSLAIVIIENVTSITELSGILNTCAFCGRIKNHQGNWQKLEPFIQENSEIDFSHGICPDCLSQYYSEYRSINVKVK